MSRPNIGHVLVLAAILMTAAVVPAAAGGDRVAVVREWNADGSAADGTTVIGWSKLKRRAGGLKANVKVEGLIPGGVYTFWWVVPHAIPPEIPFDVFVARGASAIAGRNGKATVVMRAHTGQPGIEGFPPLGGLPWHPLTDPLGALVRVEIAYHGQAEDAGGEILTWLSDFWTGSVCPVDPATPQGQLQPHCPVYFAATHPS